MQEQSILLSLTPRDEAALTFIASRYRYADFLRSNMEPEEERTDDEGVVVVYSLTSEHAREFLTLVKEEQDGYLPMMAGQLRHSVNRLVSEAVCGEHREVDPRVHWLTEALTECESNPALAAEMGSQLRRMAAIVSRQKKSDSPYFDVREFKADRDGTFSRHAVVSVNEHGDILGLSTGVMHEDLNDALKECAEITGLEEERPDHGKPAVEPEPRTQVEIDTFGRHGIRIGGGGLGQRNLQDRGLPKNSADAISSLKASGRVVVRPSTSPGAGAGFYARRLRENGTEGELLTVSTTEDDAWLSAAVCLAEYRPGEVQMTSREFGSVWTANVLCKDGSLGSLERRSRLEIRKSQGQYNVFVLERRYLRGEDPKDVRQRQEGGPFATLAEAAGYVGQYIGGYAEAAADDRAAAIEAQAESDRKYSSPSPDL